MYHLLIVETNKVANFKVIEEMDWKTLEFELLDVISSPQLAIDFISSHVVHLLIIVINAPFSEGIQLIRCLRKIQFKGEIIVLSEEHPFEIVRQAFKLRIEDYLLLSELTPSRLGKVINEVKYKLTDTKVQETNLIKQCKYEQGKMNYCLVIIVEPIGWFRRRGGEVQQDIIIPIVEKLNEIPKIKQYGEIVEYDAFRIIVTYSMHYKKQGAIRQVALQIRQAINTYFGVETTVGISQYKTESAYTLARDKAITYLSLRYIYAERSVFTIEDAEELGLDILLHKEGDYRALLKSFTDFNRTDMLRAQQKLFEDELYEDLDTCKKQCRAIIYYEALMLERNGDSLWNVWGKRVIFEEKLQRLLTSSDMIMWISNYNEFLLDYLKNKFKRRIDNSKLVRVQEYIESNYQDHLLSLRQVARAVGLNESYLSSQFKKTFEVSFVQYVTKVRIERAEQMISYTNMKVYEIGKAVGYTNVEHFVRVFKKRVGMPPREYRAQNKI